MDSTSNAHKHLTRATELVISIHQTLKNSTDDNTNVHQLKIIPQTSNLLAIIGQLVGKLETLEGELTEYKTWNDPKEIEQKLEQELLDHEIAQGSTNETSGHVKGSPPQLQRSEKFRLQQAMMEKQKYDLSKWKFTELRDTNNASCDVELLEACRVEYHRRLKVFHAWKTKNKQGICEAESERATQSMMDAAAAEESHPHPKPQLKPDNLNSEDRYFRIPFVRPGSTEERRGWWYAHFHEQYSVRQMELNPGKPPILLTAGTGDTHMCELSLEETGLTRKRGAEILEHEFQAEWARHGGADWL